MWQTFSHSLLCWFFTEYSGQHIFTQKLGRDKYGKPYTTFSMTVTMDNRKGKYSLNRLQLIRPAHYVYGLPTHHTVYGLPTHYVLMENDLYLSKTHHNMWSGSSLVLIFTNPSECQMKMDVASSSWTNRELHKIWQMATKLEPCPFLIFQTLSTGMVLQNYTATILF